MTRSVSAVGMVMAVAVAGVVVTSVAPDEARAQEVVDFDYENLSFRGVAFDLGYLYADNVEDTRTLGVRFDLGFLGPGFRLMPGVAYWSSEMAGSEVARFETRLGALTADQGGTVPLGGFDLGVISRSDIILSLDGHYIWATPLNLFFSTGVGVVWALPQRLRSRGRRYLRRGPTRLGIRGLQPSCWSGIPDQRSCPHPYEIQGRGARRSQLRGVWGGADIHLGRAGTGGG